MSDDRRPIAEAIASLALVAGVTYLTDAEIRRSVSTAVGQIVWRLRLVRWWNRLAGWEQEAHNQRHGREPLLQRKHIIAPDWLKHGPTYRQVNGDKHHPEPPGDDTT